MNRAPINDLATARFIAQREAAHSSARREAARVTWAQAVGYAPSSSAIA